MRIAVAGATGTVGHYVVDAAVAGGHEVVSLSRSIGIDLMDVSRDQTLEDLLDGVDVIVDVSNPVPATRSEKVASAFFDEVTTRLQHVGDAAGVKHLVTLSIVGVDRVPGFGYYTAKLHHEAATRRGPLPATIVRATQFHEFPAQMLSTMTVGPLTLIPSMRTQTIAARSVGAYLVEVASNTSDRPGGRVLNVAGPEPANLIDLARQYVRHRGQRARLVSLRIPGAGGRAMRDGALLPSEEVPLLGPTFTAWLDSPDGVVGP